jgi:hypothetical protein
MVKPSPMSNVCKGIQRDLLISPYKEVDFFMKNFITYEGRYRMVFHYHNQLMMRLKNEKFVNLPFFLLNNVMGKSPL